MLMEQNSRTPGDPLNYLLDSCLIYCSQVALSGSIRADDVVFDMVCMWCLLIIVKKKIVNLVHIKQNFLS